MNKCVAISLDDGQSADFEVGEFLNSIGVQPTYYLVAGRFDGKIKPKEHFGCADAQEVVKRYRAIDCEIGCHGYQHLNMSETKEKLWETEILLARLRLEELFERYIKTYAFPYGLTTQACAEWIHKKHAFETLRLFQTDYEFTPEISSLKTVDVLVGRPTNPNVLALLDRAVLRRGQDFIHISGHSHEVFSHLSKDHIKDFFKEAVDLGYTCTTVTDMYRKQKRCVAS